MVGVSEYKSGFEICIFGFPCESLVFLTKKSELLFLLLSLFFVKSELLSSFTLVDLLKRAIRTLLFFAKNCEINV